MHKYYVTGGRRGDNFPDDMLRYDQAKIVKTLVMDGRMFYLLEGRFPPTRGRWQSFLWVVIETPVELERWGLAL